MSSDFNNSNTSSVQETAASASMSGTPSPAPEADKASRQSSDRKGTKKSRLRRSHTHTAGDHTMRQYDTIYRITSQLYMLFEAGITPLAALEIMQKDHSNADLLPILKSMYDVTCQGEPFSEAVRKSGAFTPYAEQVIVIGEQTGHMDLVMKSLADFYEEEMDLRDSVKSAVAYPFAMLIMMIFIIIVLLQRIVPVFRQVYSELGAQESGLAALFIRIGESMDRFYYVFILLFAAIVAAYLWFYYTDRGRSQFRALLAWFPPTRAFSERAATGRFASGMKLTQEAGLDTFESLSLCAGVVENKAVHDRIEQCVALIRQGSSLSDAFVQVNMFSTFYSGMLNAAEQSGSIDRVMGFISRHYQEETASKLSRAISRIEPTMVIILSIIVGMILLSIILPLMGIMTTIG